MLRRQADALTAELGTLGSGLASNDALLSGILSGSGDCIKILDLDGRLQFMSEGGKRVMEVEDFDALKGCPWPSFWEGEGHTRAAAAVESAKRGEVVTFRGAANTAKGTPRFWEVRVSPIVDRNRVPTHLLSISRDITEIHERERRQKLLTEELAHRIKNTLSTVLAIASSSFKGEEHRDALEKFSGRLMALDQANALLVRNEWRRAPVRQTIEDALAPHRSGDGRFTIDGPSLDVKPNQALSLSMAINELATNALKYGSLSVPSGKVSILWNESEGDFELEWRESGGPPVATPLRTGFGSRVIRDVLASDFSGHVELQFLPEGLVCKLTARSESIAA